MTKRYDRPLTPEKLAALPDAAMDTLDIPALDAAFWRNARVMVPKVGPGAGKRQGALRLDAEVLDRFKASGRGWQTRINTVQRAYVEARREG